MLERFTHMGERDFQSALRILMARDMIYHRAIPIEDLASAIGCTKEAVYSLIRGASWYRISVPRLDHWLDLLEAAITTLTDKKGGVYASCECDPSSIESIREVIRHGAFEH